ncbi:hypothetical protein D3C81_708110 [compost metagenome]
MVLPADHAGHAGADGLVHQQVVQADEHRAQQQCYHQHPDQLTGVFTEKVDVGGALGQIDDPAQVTEQCHFDQCADQADHQQRSKAGPDLAQVVQIKRQYRTGRRGAGGFTKDIDQLFEPAKQHEEGNSCSVRPSGLGSRPCEARGQSRRLADLISIGSTGTSRMPFLTVVCELTI